MTTTPPSRATSPPQRRGSCSRTPSSLRHLVRPPRLARAARAVGSHAEAHATICSTSVSLAFCLVITRAVVNIINTWTAVELAMVSVERVHEYMSLETEAPPSSVGGRALTSSPWPPANWPHSGELNFVNVSVRYKGVPHPALASLTLHVPPRTKVGVVGRTGAGKSTLMLAMLRILEPETGTITLDAVDITRVGLDELRTRIAIVPQEPTRERSRAPRLCVRDVI